MLDAGTRFAYAFLPAGVAIIVGIVLAIQRRASAPEVARPALVGLGLHLLAALLGASILVVLPAQQGSGASETTIRATSSLIGIATIVVTVVAWTMLLVALFRRLPARPEAAAATPDATSATTGDISLPAVADEIDDHTPTGRHALLDEHGEQVVAETGGIRLPRTVGAGTVGAVDPLDGDGLERGSGAVGTGSDTPVHGFPAVTAPSGAAPAADIPEEAGPSNPSTFPPGAGEQAGGDRFLTGRVARGRPAGDAEPPTEAVPVLRSRAPSEPASPSGSSEASDPSEHDGHPDLPAGPTTTSAGTSAPESASPAPVRGADRGPSGASLFTPASSLDAESASTAADDHRRDHERTLDDDEPDTTRPPDTTDDPGTATEHGTATDDAEHGEPTPADLATRAFPAPTRERAAPPAVPTPTGYPGATPTATGGPAATPGSSDGTTSTPHPWFGPAVDETSEHEEAADDDADADADEQAERRSSSTS